MPFDLRLIRLLTAKKQREGSSVGFFGYKLLLSGRKGVAFGFVGVTAHMNAFRRAFERIIEFADLHLAGAHSADHVHGASFPVFFKEGIAQRGGTPYGNGHGMAHAVGIVSAFFHFAVYYSWHFHGHGATSWCFLLAGRMRQFDENG
jgi:hypothetical protein